jgi:hypothetical protein
MGVIIYVNTYIYIYKKGDPTALEGYALNRRHILKRLAQSAGFLGPCTDHLCRSIKVVRFQVCLFIYIYLYEGDS